MFIIYYLDKLSNAVPGIASWAEAKKGDFKEPYAISAPEKSPSDWPTNSNRKKRYTWRGYI